MQARKRFFILFLFPFFFFTSVGLAPLAHAQQAGDLGDIPYDFAISPTQSKLHIRPDDQTGAFNFSYPIQLPPGRNNLQPDFNLTYSSQNTDIASWAGYGWSLGIPSIRRIPRKGVDRLYLENFFSSSLSGELLPVDLVDETHGLYGSEVESGFLRYEFTREGFWRVTDKKGTLYVFGRDPQARQDDPEGVKVYQWMLQEVRDPNDNFVRYEYTKEQGQIYLSRIIYTGHGEEEGIFEIRFLNEPRPDVTTLYNAGFEVKTMARLRSIEILAENLLVRRYELGYESGDNGIRSLLVFITETGQSREGVMISLPPTTFRYRQSEPGWIKDDRYIIPQTFLNQFGFDNGLRLADLDGDGFSDLVRAEASGNSVVQEVYLNNGDGTGWTEAEAEVFPDPLFFTMPERGSTGLRFVDLNGDGFLDLIQSQNMVGPSTVQEVYMNRGDGTGWERDPAYQIPVFFNHFYNVDAGVRMADINGDGLPDLVQTEQGAGGGIQEVYLNKGDGTGWRRDDRYVIPLYFIGGSAQDLGVRLADVNGDGLADLVQAEDNTNVAGPSFTYHVFLNKGDGIGWIEDFDYVFPEGNSPHPLAFGHPERGNTGMEFQDVNGDGLLDLIRSQDFRYDDNRGDTAQGVYLNKGNGTGWEKDNRYDLPVFFNKAYNYDTGARMDDLNGDGLPDFIQAAIRDPARNGVYLNISKIPDLLFEVIHPSGARTTVDYKPTPFYQDARGLANPKLPMVLSTVQSITTDDGLGNLLVTRYDYEGGEYFYNNPYDRKFAGFAKVTETDALGNTNKRYYHQGNESAAELGEYEDHESKINLPYRLEIYDSQNQLVAVTINRWDQRDLGNERAFPHLVQTVSRLYTPGTPTVKATAQRFEYDEFGNTTRVLDYGEVTVGAEDGTFVDMGADLVETENTFVVTRDPYLVGLPSESRIRDQAREVLQQQRFYFDDLPLGQALKGNGTREEVWRDTDDTWLAATRRYDEYGLVPEERNPRGHATQFAYDAFHLYPVTVTNAKGHATEMAYDLGTGQVLRGTDPNNVTTQNQYDGLGRLLEVRRSNPQNLEELVTVRTVGYDDLSMPRSVHETAYADSVRSVEQYTYLDGLGRTIEEKREGPGDQWITSGTLFDVRGQIRKTLQPYFSPSFDFSAIDETLRGESFAYDALGRVTRVTNPLGNITTHYEGWKRTVTDMNNNQKEYEFDARGRSTLVTERHGEDRYVSRYANDPLGRLLNLTDAEGNRREFTYNSLSQRLTQTAPHAPGRPASQWSYAYDENGNLITRTDPKNQVITYEYDELDRMTEEDFTGTPEPELLFGYDENAFGIGRLSHASADRYRHAYVYDPWGRVVQESKQIVTRLFAFSYAYDFLEGMTSLTYPDNSTVSYTFDEAHWLSRVTMGDLVFGQNFTYSPLGQMTSMRLGNGLLITNTYDPNQLYRLTQKEAGAGERALQNLSYTYDPMGNMTELADESDGPTAKAVTYRYDPLYRLTEASYANLPNAEPFTHTFAYSPTGNIQLKSDVGNFTYESAHPHAVTQAGAEILEYDLNGNMTLRRGNLMAYDYRDRLFQYGNGIAFGYGEGYERITKVTLASPNKIKYYPSRYFEVDLEKEVKFIYAGDLKIASVEVELERPANAFVQLGHRPGGEFADEQRAEQGGNEAANASMNQSSASAESTPASKNSGGGGYRATPPKFIPKKDAKEIITFNQFKPKKMKPKEKPPVFFKSKAKAKTSIEFMNLRIQYPEGQAIFTWNAMSEEVKKFRIYRGKVPFYHPKYHMADTFLAEMEPTDRKNRFVDRVEELYAYRIEALSETDEILATSIGLNPEQLFIPEEGAEIDFSRFSRTKFNKVVLMPQDDLIFAAGRAPFHFWIQPAPGFQDGTTIDVRFLQCQSALNGKTSCEQVDAKKLGVFVITRRSWFNVIPTNVEGSAE